MAHGGAIAVGGIWAIGSFAVTKCWERGNRGEQDGEILQLCEDFGPDIVAGGAGRKERVDRYGIFRRGVRKILAEYRAELFVVALNRRTKQMRDNRSEEKPPDLKGAIESGELKRFDAESLVL
jgi:hypothetical protein